MTLPPLLAAAERLTFAEPRLFALAGLIPLLVLLRVLGLRRKERGLRRMVAAGLRPKLVLGERPRRALALFVAEMLGLALVVAALARPQFGETERQARSEGRNLILAIDTSRSMLATDLEPDRLTRAKLAATDLIRALPNDRIGVMAFAGNAVLQVPLTIDHAAITETLDQLDIYSIEKGGSDLGTAIDLAIEHFGKIAADKNALILFTDGEDLAGKGLDAAERAAEKGILIITVGIGSTLGSIVPDTGAKDEGQFIRDRSGDLVKSRLDVDSLEKIAARTHGIFINLNARSLNADLVENMLQQLDTTRDESTARTVPLERYQWPLAVGTLLLSSAFILPAFRRAHRFLPATAAFLVTAAGVLAPSSVRAGSADDAWRAYNDEDYSEAIDLYGQAIGDTRSPQKRARLEFGRGSAAYRAGDLDTALDAFSKSLLDGDEVLRANSHYNLGNTLFRRGEGALKPKTDGAKPAAPKDLSPVLADWESAAQHYDDTLVLNPGNESAKRNAAIVRQHIEELKKQQQQQQQQQQQEQEKKDEQQKNEEPKDNEKQDENEKKEQEDKEGQPEEEKDGAEQKQDEGEKEGEEKGEDEGDKEGEKPEEGEGEPSEKPQEGKEGEEAQPDSEGSGDGEDSGREPGTDGEPGAEGEGGEEQEAALSEDEKINPETGYSKMDAERILRMLSDEQLDMKPLRRRVRTQNIDDW